MRKPGFLNITHSALFSGLVSIGDIVIFRPKPTQIMVAPLLVAAIVVCCGMFAWDIDREYRTSPPVQERRLYGLLAIGAMILIILNLLAISEYLPPSFGRRTYGIAQFTAYAMALAGAPIVYYIGYWCWASFRRARAYATTTAVTIQSRQ